MKHLIVGIDGGTASIFDQFSMPFWESLRSKSVLYDIKEDLNHRGWAKIISGQGAHETGALYMRPESAMNKFSIKYNYKMLSASANFNPIWSWAERNNLPVGLMNIPTTFPAQSVNGFYVSGGGGGIFQAGIPSGSIYPSEIQSILDSNNYIFDTRLGSQNKSFNSLESFSDHLVNMMKIRTKSFIQLAKRYDIQFGFLAYRAATSLFYLAMSEISFYLSKSPAKVPFSSTHAGSWPALVRIHLKILDECLDELFQELQPQNYIIVSDHSIVPWTHNIDFNGFLDECGYSRFDSSCLSFAKSLSKLIVNKKYRSQFSQSLLKNVYKQLSCSPSLLSKDSLAFSGRYVYGIYINDAKRFSGPVNQQSIHEEAEKIIDSFNWTALRKNIPMKAVQYRQNFKNSAFMIYYLMYILSKMAMHSRHL